MLTGTENFISRIGEPSNVFFLEIFNTISINNQAICSHYINQDSGNFASLQDKHVIVRVALSMDKTYICLRDSTFPQSIQGANQLKSWLAAQYAAGTPVTVWYVLATPTTGIVNEPLAKIGDYADELHSSDAGVTIPTIKGQNTLTVDTELQPSSMTITYKK